jgi:hypothetical protein
MRALHKAPGVAGELRVLLADAYATLAKLA